MRAFRRIFLLGAALAAALFVYAWQIEPRSLRVRYISVGEGASVGKFALVSDLHIGGSHVPPKRVLEIVRRINQEPVDFTIMPGDFIDGHEPRSKLKDSQRLLIDQGLSLLEDLETPAIATLGNHDTWHDPVAVRDNLEAANVIVLDNEAVRVRGFCFVGLADSDTGSPSALAFKDCGAEDWVIAVMHSPDARGLLSNRIALAVAGHTHGGQVNLPILGRAVTSTACGTECAYGLIQKSPPLIVTSGIGTSILPVRFRSPPEIVIIDLRRDPSWQSAEGISHSG